MKDRLAIIRARNKKWRKDFENIYHKLKKLIPTYDEIKEWAGNNHTLFTSNDNNPFHIHLHDTWRVKLNGRLHIDIVSGEYHLMLDKSTAPKFLNFIIKKRNMKLRSMSNPI